MTRWTTVEKSGIASNKLFIQSGGIVLHLVAEVVSFSLFNHLNKLR